MHAKPAPRSRRLLVVDDKVEIHEDFAKILGPSPASDDLDADEAALFGASPPTPPIAFDMDFADRGEVGLELVRRSVEESAPYALAFVDVRMPNGWDGVRTVGELWTVDPRIQVVLCTAYADYSWDEIAGRLGVGADFLILKKPFEVIEVRQIAHALTQKWALLQEKKRHLDELEEEVRRRTAELAAANERLQLEMTSRVRIEKERRHAQKLEALGRLAAGIGHEINNPLTFINGSLLFCREELARLQLACQDVSFGPMSDAIDEAAGGTERIARIVGEIRHFSRASEAALGPVDVPASLRAAQRMVDHTVRYRASIVERIDQVPAVIGDASQLEQVLVNLLLNAAQAFPPETAAVNEIAVSAHLASSGDVVLEVRDNGVGIAEENLDRVFDPFFTTREVGEGTGLGLSISRGIVERFGGRIEIESELGRGTVVRLRLRRAAAVAEAAPAPRSTAAAPTISSLGHRILVIDDEPAVLHVIQRMLRTFDVCVTTDGAEGIELYRSSGFDLVLCDLMMPGVSGMEVHRTLSALGPEHVERMVFVTGGAYTEEGAAFLAGVSNPYLDKPFTRAQLHQLVETQLTRRCQGSRTY